MNIFEFEFENWYTFCLRFNWLALIVAVVVIVVVKFVAKKFSNILAYHSIEFEEFSLGIGQSNIKLKYNKKDQEIAYKLWVELNTRKIGIPYDVDYDVISEVYDSWYDFFKTARELLKDVPPSRLPHSTKLITVTTDVLNKGLRPHLTKWQAKYRKWYDNNRNASGSPQEIQRDFPEYDELLSDLLITNKNMIEYKKLMYKIAFNKK